MQKKNVYLILALVVALAAFLAYIQVTMLVEL